ncbi:hypothetical protein AGMMS50222_07960 [Endomicrobiia bacterium]|nr:hypothetical protein AGMMS50222_07960 [Endomicrobiia bacterium]
MAKVMCAEIDELGELNDSDDDDDEFEYESTYHSSIYLNGFPFLNTKSHTHTARAPSINGFL